MYNIKYVSILIGFLICFGNPNPCEHQANPNIGQAMYCFTSDICIYGPGFRAAPCPSHCPMLPPPEGVGWVGGCTSRLWLVVVGWVLAGSTADGLEKAGIHVFMYACMRANTSYNKITVFGFWFSYCRCLLNLLCLLAQIVGGLSG